MSSGLLGQNFVVNGDFKDLNFFNPKNKVENGFAQLKLLDNYSWLTHSSSDLLIYFENAESKYASINVSKKQFIQTELCCYPSKDLFYDLQLKARMSPFSMNALSYIQVYFLSKPYVKGQDLSTEQVLILTIDPTEGEWQMLKGQFKSNGNERFVLLGVVGEFKNDIIIQKSALAYDEDIFIDLYEISLHLAKGQQDDQKASKKVEF